MVPATTTMVENRQREKAISRQQVSEQLPRYSSTLASERASYGTRVLEYGTNWYVYAIVPVVLQDVQHQKNGRGQLTQQRVGMVCWRENG